MTNNFSERLNQVDFSKNSRQRGILRARLLSQASAQLPGLIKKEKWNMQTFTFVRLTAIAAAVIVFTLFVNWLVGSFVPAPASGGTPTPAPDINQVVTATFQAMTQEAQQTAEAAPTETLVPVVPSPTNTSNIDTWVWHTIDLYSLKVKLPLGWTISEVNRRPEPTGNGGPITGHDCAEYQLTSADNLSVLSLRPTCGFAEAFPGSYPPDTVIINPQSENSRKIGRYFADGKYIYADTNLITYSDLTGDHQETVCITPPYVIIAKKEGFIMASLDFQSLGNETNLNQLLAIVNQITLSISEK